MNQSASPAERFVVGAGVLVTAVWSAVAIWVSFGYDGTTAASTWTVRSLLLGAVGAVTAAVVLAMWAGWRRALRMPLKKGRANAWLAHRRWWQLALFYWLALWGLPSGVLGVWLHLELHALQVGTSLLVSVLVASFMALTMRVVFLRQIRNREVLERR